MTSTSARWTTRIPGSDVTPAETERVLQDRLTALMDEGWDLWTRFDAEVRQKGWHSFVAADYERVRDALLALRAPGLRFLELGSATGVISIMADLLGYDAQGIEIDDSLVKTARALAARYESGARFVTGSFLPTGFRFAGSDGDGRLGTIGESASAYPALGRLLEDYDVVFAYPWPGEEPMIHALMRAYGRAGARLILHRSEGVEIHVNGRATS